MGRASTITLLPLDRWAAIVGINPRHFNQVEVPNIDAVPHCKNVWTQYAWQRADYIGREEVAMAIAKAEEDIIEVLGFLPIPRWIEGEIHRTPGSRDVSLLGCSNLSTPAGRFRGVRANYGHMIYGGIRQVETIETVSIPTVQAQWFDHDGDTYFETLEISVAYTGTDTNEIRLYFEDEAGNDIWEIRPLKNVTCDGTTLTIEVDRHLLVRPVLWEALNPASIDGMVDANFNQTLEVCRVYNDPSSQAQLQWERIPSTCDCGSLDCEMCAWTVQAACLQTRDPRLGIVNYQPGSWDSDDEQFDPVTIAVDRQPERVRLWYRAGYQSSRVKRPMVEMHPEFERMITMYSLCLLDRPICGCSNVENFYSEWTEDRALVSVDAGYHRISNRDLNCEWGTKKAALDAWKTAMRYALGGAVKY